MSKKQMKKSLRHHSHHIDKKLQFRLWLYFVIALIMVSIVGYDIFKEYIPFFLSLFGIVLGVGIGLITARMYHLSWNHDAKKIMARLDIFGIAILVLYISFAIFRNRLIGHFVHGPTVSALSFSVVAGIMIGRVLGTRGKIITILKEQMMLS